MRVFGSEEVLKNAKFARSFKVVRNAKIANFLRRNARFLEVFARKFLQVFFSDFFVSFSSFLNVKSASFWHFLRFFSVLNARILNVFGVFKNARFAFKFVEVFERNFRNFRRNVFKNVDSFKFLVFVRFFKYFKNFRVFTVVVFKFFRVFRGFARGSAYG